MGGMVFESRTRKAPTVEPEIDAGVQLDERTSSKSTPSERLAAPWTASRTKLPGGGRKAARVSGEMVRKRRRRVLTTKNHRYRRRAPGIGKSLAYLIPARP